MRQPPRVVFLINTLATGGAEKQLLLVAGGLARRGFRCEVIVLHPAADPGAIARLLREVTAAGVAIRAPRGVGAILAELLRFLREALADPPVVWTWGYRADGVRALSWLFARPAATVVSLRSAFGEKIQRWRFFWWLVDATADLYVSNSALNARFLAEVQPAAAPKLRVIHNAIEPALLEAPAVALPARIDRLRVVMLGNLRLHAKGYDLVVRLGERLRDAALPVRIVIGGADPENGVLAAQIARAGVQAQIELAGMIRQPAEFLRTGDAFLLFSRYEGQPNALLEAMALGLPCIATRVGDVATFTCDGVHLRQVDIGDVDGAFGALRDFLHDWEAAREIGRRGRALCQEQFATERMVGRVAGELAPFFVASATLV